MPERVGVEPKEEDEEKPLFELVEAPSNRSTCKASGEKIEKGQMRIGMQAFVGGRMSTLWQLPKPFLEGCRVEKCLRAGSGKCKHTGHKFEKGEPRFVAHIGPDKKTFLTLGAAGELLPPVMEAAGGFKTTSFMGLDALSNEHRAEFYKAFSVSKTDAAAFDKQHPPPAADDAAAASSASKKRKSGAAAGGSKGKQEAAKPAAKRTRKAAKKEESEEEEEEEADEEAEDSGGEGATKVPASKRR